MKELKLKKKTALERFTINMPDMDIYFIENLARKNGVSMSWIYRAILFALEKKFAKAIPEENRIHRPVQFNVDFRQTVICFYGDKQKWMSLSRVWKTELGPLIRFALILYQNGDLELDFENIETVKKLKSIKPGKIKSKKRIHSRNRYTYQYQNKVITYLHTEFWPKNQLRNIFLMERGLKNRIYPLKLSE